MKVIHCKKEHLANTIYIGRPSKWGNPFSHLDGTLAKFKVSSREEAIEKHKKWLFEISQLKLLQSIDELRGSNLSCWCAPKPCHGDILLEIANRSLKLGSDDLELIRRSELKMSGAEVHKVRTQIYHFSNTWNYSINRYFQAIEDREFYRLLLNTYINSDKNMKDCILDCREKFYDK